MLAFLPYSYISTKCSYFSFVSLFSLLQENETMLQVRKSIMSQKVSHMIIKDVPEHNVQLSLPFTLIQLLLLCMHITKRGALFSLPWRGNILGKSFWNRSRMLRVVGVLKVLYSTLKSSLKSNTINSDRLRINLLFLLLLSREGIYNAFPLSLHTGLPDLGWEWELELLRPLYGRQGRPAVQTFKKECLHILI